VEEFGLGKDMQIIKGHERCTLPPGIGARFAAEIIIESMAKKQ
jgi:hypothetical protein